MLNTAVSTSSYASIFPKSARTSSAPSSATSSVKVVNDERETDASARLASDTLLSHHQHVHQSSSKGCKAFLLLGLAHICTLIKTFQGTASTQGLQTSSQAINQQARCCCRRRRCDRSIKDSSPAACSTEEEPRRATSRQCESSGAERPGGRREQHTT